METDPYDDPSLYIIEPVPCMKRFKKIFRLIDLYAIPVTLRYKQEKKFYTNWGAGASVFVILVMLAFFVTNIVHMVGDTKTTETVSSKLVKNKVAFKTTNGLSTNIGDFLFGFRILDA